MAAELDLEAISARHEAAYDELIRICSVGEHTRMSIPANPARDTDLLISAALKDTVTLMREIARLHELAEIRQSS